MTLTTTPEVVEPNELNAYAGFDFSGVVSGARPDGGDAIRLTQSADTGKQSLWQALRSDSMLMQGDPVEPAVSFWVRRLQNFAGAATGWQAASFTNVVDLGPSDSGGCILGVGNAPRQLDDVSSYALSWGFFGTNDDDLYLAYASRLSGSGYWYTRKVADLALNEWTHIVWNKGAQQESSSGPSGRLMELYVNGIGPIGWFPSYTSSSGGTWPVFESQMQIGRFGIGDPCVSELSVQGETNGPLLDLAEISFHEDRLTHAQVWSLYESMLYG